jgi:hypothetical protein
LHYIIWSAQSKVCRQYTMMSTCQVGINDDDLGKKPGARRAISIIRHFEDHWRPIGCSTSGQASSALGRHIGTPTATPLSGSSKRCLRGQTAVSNWNWRCSRWNWS